MICYKDMTFCQFHSDCKKAKNCDRALTEKVKADARKRELAICIFAEQPECHEDVIK